MKTIDKCDKCPLKTLAGHEKDLCIDQKLGVRAHCRYIEEGHEGYINIVIKQSLSNPDDDLSPTKIQPPSIVQRAVDFAGAMANYAFSGFQNSSEEEAARRLKICEGCDKFIAEKRTCALCTCPMDFKVKITSTHCPDHPSKW